MKSFKTIFNFIMLAGFCSFVMTKTLFAVQATGEMPVPEELFTDPQTLPTVKLEDLIREVEEKNPDIAASRAEWKAAKKRILQAWALSDPMIGMDAMGAMTETRVGPQENRMMVSQAMPFPLKLWEKRKAAKSASEAAKQRYLAVRRDRLNELRQAFYNFYETDASLQVIHELHNILKKIESTAQTRYSNRQGSQRDVAKAQAEVSLTLEQVYALQQKRETYVALINAILDRSPLSPLGVAERPEKKNLSETLPELITSASQNRQEIKEMEALAEERVHEKRLTKMQWIPDADVGFSYTWVGNGMTTSMDDGKDSWMIPIRINVPLWQNRLIPALQEADQELQAARAQLLSSRNEAFYEVKDAYVRYQTALKIESLYEAAIIPQAELALKSDQAGYEAGQTDFLDLLDSERIYLNAKLSQIRFFSEILKSHSDLLRATGLDLAPGSQEGEQNHEAQ